MLKKIYSSAIFKAFPLPALLLLPDNPRYTIAEVNRAYLRNNNVTENDLTGNSFFTCFPATAGDGIEEELRDSLHTVISTRKAHTGPAIKFIIHTSGQGEEVIWYGLPENIPVLDDEGNVAYIIHVVHDVMETQMSMLLNNTEEAFILLDKNLDVIFFNKKFGQSYNEYLGINVKKGNSILDYAQAERKETVKSIYSKVLSGVPQESEISIPLPGGIVKHFTLKYNPTRDNNNQVIGVFVTLRDVSEEKELQKRQQEIFSELTNRVTQASLHTAELTRIKTNQESLINGTQDLIWSIDSNLHIITANKAYIEMIRMVTGKAPTEGDSVLVDEFGEELNKKWSSYYQRALSGEMFSVQEQVYDPGKQKIICGWISFNPMRSVDGSVFGAACYSKDITNETENLLALQNAEEQLTRIMNSSLDVICTIDEAGNFIRLSAATERMWGYTPDELVGMPFRKLVHPADLIKTEKAAANIMAGISMTHFENRYIRKDGSCVPLIWSAMWNNKDKTMYCVARDATEKINHETVLIESEKKYKYLFENNPLPMIIWDFETMRIIEANEEALFKYGYTLKEFLQITIKDIRPPEQIPIIEEAISTGTKFGVAQKKVWIHKKKSGELMHIEVAAHLIEYNGRKACLELLHDITEKIKAEEQKEYEKRDKEALINNTSDLIWSVSTDFKLIAANTAFAKNFEKVTGTNIHPGDALLSPEFFSDEYLQFWMGLYIKALTGESFQQEIYTPEFRNRNKSWSEISFNPIYQLETVVGIACYSRNITEAKLAQEQILTNETLLAEAQRLAKMGSWNFDFKGDKLLWSEELYNVFGADKKTFLETHGSFISLVDDEDREFVFQTSVNTRETGEPFTIEYHITTPQGEKKIIEEHGYGEKDANGNVVRLFGTAQDITERKKAEEEIRASNQRFEYVTRATFEAIWDWNLAEETIYWGEGLHSIFGYDLGTIKTDIGSWTDHIHPEDIDRVLKGIHQLIDGDETHWSDEYRYQKADKSYAFVIDKGFVIRNSTGKALRMVGAMQDITRQKKEEQRLKLLESVITNTHDAIVITQAEPFEKPDGPKILYVNDAFTKMTGYSFEEVLGKTPRILQGDKTNKKELKNLATAIRKRQSYETTVINYKKNGEEFWINFMVSPVTDEKGVCTHFIAVERDVTEKKLSELQLKNLNEKLLLHTKELAISNMELEQFAYVASHDLQEPLRMVTNFLSQIEKKYGDIIDEKGKKYIFFATDGAKRMRQIILDLLEYSRVGKTQDQQEKIDLNELINNIQVLFRKQIEEKQAVFCIDQLPIITTYRSPIHQIFLNLISNALKYRKPAEPCRIHIFAKEFDTHWQFAVEDNGLGIEKEYFDKIFILFQRLHNKTEYSGTGIGLSITKKLVENLGGKIWVESQEGVGSTFYFTFIKNIFPL